MNQEMPNKLGECGMNTKDKKELSLVSTARHILERSGGDTVPCPYPASSLVWLINYFRFFAAVIELMVFSIALAMTF